MGSIPSGTIGDKMQAEEIETLDEIVEYVEEFVWDDVESIKSKADEFLKQDKNIETTKDIKENLTDELVEEKLNMVRVAIDNVKVSSFPENYKLGEIKGEWTVYEINADMNTAEGLVTESVSTAFSFAVVQYVKYE